MKYPSRFFTLLFLPLVLLMLSASAQKKKKDFTPLVDPFIGTGGNGHTFPGALVPFGMVQTGPDTRLDEGKYSGYNYTDSVIYGFSHTQIDGTDNHNYCDILFMPTTGDPKLNAIDYKSAFKKKNESASPGYYKTKLDKYNIEVELTATKRVAIQRYNFPGGAKQANVIIDLSNQGQISNSLIEVVNDHEIRGFSEFKPGVDNQFVYFYAKFSKAFKVYSIALNNELQPGKSKAEGANLKMYIQFDNPGEVISKVGVSAVSVDGALRNLNAEVPDFDFKKVQKAAKNDWLNELAKIEVEGGAPIAMPIPVANNQGQGGYGNPYGQPAKPKIPLIDYAKIKQTIFYTALYHTMCAPNIYSDVDGQYRGLDNNIHKAEGFEYYSPVSLGNISYTGNPLQTVINKKRTLDFVKSILTFGGVITGKQISIIVDAYTKGIKDFDASKALTAMEATANSNQKGLDSFRANGFVPADEKGSVTKTLTYAINSWSIAQMAKMLNKQTDYSLYIKRAQYWKNIYDEHTSFMRGRVNGGWFMPFTPAESNVNYTQGNAWQYAFLVPQDVQELIDYMGGKDKFEAKLDEFFITSNKPENTEAFDVSAPLGQYLHGSSIDNNIAYLYNFTDNPYKTQLYINRIMRQNYRDKPDGLAGDDTGGQLSAWYVMSALGFYSILPGQTDLQIGLPTFDKATINLENGKTFTISGSGSSGSSFYLQGMNLNKNPYNKLFLTYNDITNGGDWEVYTGKLPNKLFMQDLERSASKITDELIVANPYITYPAITTKTPATITLVSADSEAKIYYTLDGSLPTINSALFTKPVTISTNTTIKCIAVKNGKSSFVTEAKLTK